MKERYAANIHLIWYINSFFFVLFLGLGIAAEKNNTTLFEICGSYDANCKAAFEMLTNFRDEVYLIVAVTGLAIVPQWLAYTLSGFSGVAAYPKFIRQTQAIAVWSLVKFMAGLGGIICAGVVAKMVAGKQLITLKGLEEFAFGFFYTVCAFVYAAFYVYLMTDDRDWRPFVKRAVTWIYKFSTRHIPEKLLDKSDSTAQDLELPKI